MEKITINEFKSADKGTLPCIKLAAFDFDFTLIKPLSSEFPRDVDDFILYRKTVPAVLEKYWNDGYLVVIFTNQSRNTLGAIARIKKAIEKYSLKVHYVYCSIGTAKKKTSEDKFRKPGIGMYEELVKSFPIDVSASFYCGDAAGREGDFSDSDKEFAKACKLDFKLPEDIFPLQNDEIKMSNGKNMIIMIGAPASGKSTLCATFKFEHEYVSSDKLKTKAKTIAAAEIALRDGKTLS